VEIKSTTALLYHEEQGFDIAESIIILSVTCMISGARNLAYMSRGQRSYGQNPIIPRARGVWEIEFILSGRARPTGVDCKIASGPGPRVYISPPDSSHGWIDDGNAVSEVFALHFRDLPDELRDCVTPAKPTLVEMSQKEYRALAPNLEAVWKESALKNLPASLLVQRLMIEIVQLAVLRLDPTTIGPAAIDVSNRALSWLEENIGERPDVAKAVGVSSSHLRRLFAVAGKPSPKSELTRLRIEAAQRCLRSHWKQEAIAQFLGYSDVSTFARAFRAVCGMPPRVWMNYNK
jgi:AraC-like DNA-binding protein